MRPVLPFVEFEKFLNATTKLRWRVVQPVIVSAVFCILYAAQLQWSLAQESPPPTAEVDFAKGVLPILTQAGCNTGACHGAAAGRGYLALSLFGSRPSDDYEMLLHRLPGRFIDLERPESSLLLQKPSGFLDHAGGVRIDDSGDAYRRLLQWIGAGAPSGSLQTKPALLVKAAMSNRPLPDTPIVLEGETISLQVTARWSDGTEQTASAWVAVDGATGFGTDGPIEYMYDDSGLQFRINREGYWPVTLRFASSTVTVPFWGVKQRPRTISKGSGTSGTENTSESMNPIDALLVKTYTQLNWLPDATASPQTVARRLYVDLLGRHPNREEWMQTAAMIESGNLRDCVDQILDQDEFSDHAARQIASWVQSSSKSKLSTDRLRQEIRTQIVQDDNLMRLFREMLTFHAQPPQAGNVSVRSPTAVAFHQFAGDPRSRAELVASVAMGVRIGCAQCHDHPLDRWTQDDYFGMAASWAELEVRGPTLERIVGRTTTDLRSGQPAIAKLPEPMRSAPTTARDSQNVTQQLGSPDLALVNWLCSPQNAYFSRNIANRTWAWLTGIGLVEELDDQRSTNPPISPQLLSLLESELRDHRFSLKHLVRTIVLSQAYSRSSSDSAPLLRRQLAAGHQPKTVQIPLERLIASALEANTERQDSAVSEDDSMRMESAAATDSCSRGSVCMDPVSQGIDLVTGRAINDLLAMVVERSRTTSSSISGQLERWHQQILGRSIDANHLQELLNDYSQLPAEDQPGYLEDVLWSWVMSDDFRRLH